MEFTFFYTLQFMSSWMLPLDVNIILVMHNKKLLKRK